jgi:serine/threonine protein kinase/formylglycine-generating enzyme required for sulfatase activity
MIDHDPLDELLVEWELRRQAGDCVSAAALCANRPELISALETRIAALRATDWLFREVEDDLDAPGADVSELAESLTLDDLRARLVASGLLSNEELDEVVAGDAVSSVGLLARLRRDGRLTEYQARRVCAGRVSGLVFGDYVVLEEIGTGGMGQVYRAWRRGMKRVVALKVLPERLLGSPAGAERFQREIEAAARLEHPHIVTAYDAGEHGGQPYLAMQFVAGCDLSTLVETHGPLPLWQGVDYALQAARGLAHAHRHGVVHRDVKPSNLLVDSAGVVRVSDFGLARLLRTGDKGANLTCSDEAFGTLDYMAPEQASGAQRADARSDIYSLGCSLFRLLTGKPPFGDSVALEKLRAHERAPRPKLCDVVPAAPTTLEATLAGMIAADRDERFQSMDEVVAALESVIELLPRDESSAAVALGSAEAARPGSTDMDTRASTRRRESAAKPGAKRRWIWAIPVAALLALAAYAVVDWRKETEERPAPSPPSTTGDGPAPREAAPSDPQPPSPAIAPFDAEEATNAQRRWAEFLSASVEFAGPAGIKLRLIPVGEFARGLSDSEWAALGKPAREEFRDELPCRRVTISRPFYLAVCETSGRQFREVVGADPRFFPNIVNRQRAPAGDLSDLPAFHASWLQAVAFCNLLSQRGGVPAHYVIDGETVTIAGERGFRLPTEAEWEYACRAGTETLFSTGNGIDSAQANLDDQFEFLSPVGSFAPNAFGLFDMHGNAAEFCWDWYAADYYVTSPAVDPSGPRRGSQRVVRGGSAFHSTLRCRSAARGDAYPTVGGTARCDGFRVACDVETARAIAAAVGKNGAR